MFRLSDSCGWSIVLIICTAFMLMQSHQLQSGEQCEQFLPVLAMFLLPLSPLIFIGENSLCWKQNSFACASCLRDRNAGIIMSMSWDASYRYAQTESWWRFSRPIMDQMMSMALFIGTLHADCCYCHLYLCQMCCGSIVKMLLYFLLFKL